MKKLIILTAVATALLGAAAAHAEGMMGGLGFRTLNGAASSLINTGVNFSASPAIGIRQWVNPSVGLDFAVGFASLSAKGSPPTTKLDEGTGFVVDLGIPFAVKKWDKVNFIFRPGATFGSAEATDKLAPTPPDKLTSTSMSFSGEFEVELMLADKVSISAAHGIAYRSIKLKDNDSPKNELEVKGFETTGDNFTSLGFHVYLW